MGVIVKALLFTQVTSSYEMLLPDHMNASFPIKVLCIYLQERSGLCVVRNCSAVKKKKKVKQRYILSQNFI